MSDIIYTEGQLKGWETFAKFYLNPLETVMVIEGYSGTGKSTLVDMLLKKLPDLDDMRRLIDPTWQGMKVYTTATTNQAALSLSQATGGNYDTGTVHSVIRVRPIQEDYKQRNKTKLVAHGREKIANALILVDESSYIDRELMAFIFSETENCKFVFIGDPDQLTPVGSTYMPAFKMGTARVKLTQPMRFDQGPIFDMVANLRDTVTSGEFHKMKLVPGVLDHVGQDEFNQLALHAFQNPDKYGVTKILAFYNDTVVGYNNYIAHHILGTHELQKGQRVSSVGGARIGTTRVFNNEEVLIVDVVDGKRHGVYGKEITLKHKGSESWFMPQSRADFKKAHAMAAAENDYEIMREIIEEWVDLRPDYAKTVNKAQGSTYDTVFVDIGDIYRGARTADQLARYLYVANSRCRSRIVMTGDMG